MSSFIITCPNCNHQFEPGDSMRDEIEKELRGKMMEWQKKKDEETRKLIEAEKKKMQDELQESIRKSVATDFENQLKMLHQNAADAEEKLKDARKKELEFLQKEQSLKIKEEELQLTVQRQLMEEREKLKEQLQKEETERSSLKEQEHQLRMKELEKQLDDQKKLAEEMRRKSEQGSMQLQGEVLELALEGLLKSEFQYDDIREVKKGEEGGDIIQQVYNDLRKECGRGFHAKIPTHAYHKKLFPRQFLFRVYL